MRRQFLKQMAVLSSAAAVSPWVSAQAAWPTKPLKLLVPFPPGGSVDPIARVFAQFGGAVLGQSIVVENRAGANTALAAGAVAKADPDGYTLLFSSVSSHLIHTVQTPRGYDSITDYEPVAAVSRAYYVMAVHESVPVKTVAEFVAYAKANPGKLNFAVTGVGGANHLACELFNLRTGVKVDTIPYKGGGPAMVDFMAGRVQAMITNTSTLKPQIDSGVLRALAYTTPPADRPQAPTFAQQGLKEFENFEQINIILAPKGTPAAVVAKLADAAKQAVDKPEAKTAIERAAQDPLYMPPAALRQVMVASNAVIREIVQKANIKFE